MSNGSSYYPSKRCIAKARPQYKHFVTLILIFWTSKAEAEAGALTTNFVLINVN
jgi:hypothetical protein